MTDQRNWAGNYTYRAERWHTPQTIDELRATVAACSKLRALGTRHSFNGIADSTEDIVSLEHFNRVVALDGERRAVTVEGGIKYGQLGRYLHEEGYAIHNLASLPHISVAGACATATHGSGDGNGNLASAVRALELVTADGDVKTLTREQDGDAFRGAVVGLGGLGVVTQLTLDIEPTFAVRQDLYENLPLAQLEDHFDAISARAYSISLFTDWQEARFNQVWIKTRVTPGVTTNAVETDWFGATPANGPLHPIPGADPIHCTEQMGVPGPWHERLPHFRMGFTPSSGDELQTEYMTPRRHVYAAFQAIYALREQIAPLLQISEIRTVAADDLWMSTCYGEDCVGIHFTWIHDWPAVERLLPTIEAAFAPFAARPHWGKLFTMSPQQLQPLYPKLPAFRELLHSYDPDGKFRNAFLNAYIF